MTMMLCVVLSCLVATCSARDVIQYAACDSGRPDNVTVPGTQIRSPNYPSNYPPNSLCDYRFVNTVDDVPPTIAFDTFVLESSADCAKDYVNVYDGWDNTARLIGSYCGSTPPRSISGTTNALYLRFGSDQAVEDTGFQVSFFVGNIACTAARPETLTSPGNITSPNHPDFYPANQDCEWHIAAPEGQLVHLTVSNFQMEAEGCCTCDYLQIMDGDSVDDPLYGHWFSNDAVPSFVSRSNNVYVRFHSDGLGFGAGFHLAYNFVTV